VSARIRRAVFFNQSAQRPFFLLSEPCLSFPRERWTFPGLQLSSEVVPFLPPLVRLSVLYWLAFALPHWRLLASCLIYRDRPASFSAPPLFLVFFFPPRSFPPRRNSSLLPLPFTFPPSSALLHRNSPIPLLSFFPQTTVHVINPPFTLSSSPVLSLLFEILYLLPPPYPPLCRPLSPLLPCFSSLFCHFPLPLPLFLPPPPPFLHPHYFRPVW